MSAFSYAGKRVFITGGSSGIGNAMATQLVDAGAHVYIAARGQDRLEQAAAKLRERAPSSDQIIGSVVMDVGDRASVVAGAKQLLEGLGGLDVLINNAGIVHPGAFLDIPDEVFDSTMRVNYFGPVNVTRALLPALIEAGEGGRIAFVSSLAGVIGIYGYTAYASSKFALRGFAEALRQDLLHHGIRITLVFPPDTDTEQLAAENEMKPPETHVVAGNVKVLSPAFVASESLAGIRRARFHVVPGFGSKFSAFMAGRFPALTRWFIDGDLRRYHRREGRLSLPSGS